MKKISSAMVLGLFALLVLCLMTAGCTGTTSEDADDTPYGASSTVTAGETGASGAAPGSVTAVPFAALIAFLPDAPAGWTAEDPAGMTWADEESQWTWASREYTKDNARTTIMIQDSAYYDVGYWQSWDSMISFESTDGYYKQGKAGGYPSWEYFTKPDSYGTWVGVNDRFMVYVSVEGGSKSDLDAFVNAVNYGGIANLK